MPKPDLRLKPRDFRILCCLGTGTYGKVRGCLICNMAYVAVPVLFCVFGCANLTIMPKPTPDPKANADVMLVHLK